MISLEELDALQQAKPSRDDLVDIQNVHIDTSLPLVERIQNYIAQIKNPYHFRHGNSAVNISFASDGIELKTHLRNYFVACKQG